MDELLILAHSDSKKDGTLVTYSLAFRGHHVKLHLNEQNLHSRGQVLHIKGSNLMGKIILSKSMKSDSFL